MPYGYLTVLCYNFLLIVLTIVAQVQRIVNFVSYYLTVNYYEY